MLGFIKRALVRGVVLSGLVVSLLLTVASGASADVDSEPNSATPGSVVTVSGSVDIDDLPVGGMQEVDICWNTPNCDDPMATTTVGLLDTTYSVDVTIPDVEPDEYEIYACTSLDGCDSAEIEVVAEMTTTTTTVAATTTTNPQTTTSITTRPTTTTTTTTGPATTTTTSPTPASSTISPEDMTTTTPASSPPGASEDTEVAAVSLQTDDLGPPPAESQKSTSPTSPSRTYTPPTTAYTPPDNGTATTISEDEPVVVNAADAVDSGGWSFESPVVFWTAWLLVVIIASALASTLWWLADRRRRAQ